MPSLLITTGPRTGDHFPLGRRTNVVGRDEGASIQILDDHVSRKHLQIRYDKDADQYIALDMKSRHGVFLNGTRLAAEAPLADNDSLDLGGVTLLFTLQDFPDRDSALAYHKKVGQRARGTLLE